MLVCCDFACVVFAWLCCFYFPQRSQTAGNGNILGFGSLAKTCGNGSRNWKRHFASSFASPRWSDNFNKKSQILALPPLMAPPLDLPLCTVSVQYLQQPEKVFAEVFRVLRPGGAFIVSFSNRLFYEKAIGAWRDGTGYSRVQLVVQYFQCVEGFTQPEIIRKVPAAAVGPQQEKSPFGWIMRLLGLVSGSDPFYAVVAYKNFKPVYE